MVFLHEEATKMIQVYQKAPVLADLQGLKWICGQPHNNVFRSSTLLVSCSCLFMSVKLSLHEQAQRSPYI
jgi:hypothetical protein